MFGHQARRGEAARLTQMGETMTINSDEFGFARPDVSGVARRQLTFSAAILAIVGCATLAVTQVTKSPSAEPAASAKFERVAPGHAAQKLERPVSAVRPG